MVLADVLPPGFKAPFGGLDGLFFPPLEKHLVLQTEQDILIVYGQNVGPFCSGRGWGAVREREVKCDVHSVRKSLAGLQCPKRMVVYGIRLCTVVLISHVKPANCRNEALGKRKRRTIQQLMT